MPKFAPGRGPHSDGKIYRRKPHKPKPQLHQMAYDAQRVSDTQIDCYINHPVHGPIKYTADANAPDDECRKVYEHLSQELLRD